MAGQVVMEYYCVARSATGFVQQLASCYLPHGYWFYVSGIIPPGKEPTDVDRKLIEKYAIGVSRSTRARRKAAGMANLHYLRLQRRFLLLATHGQHPFFDDEEKSIRDARRIPIRFGGYSITVKQGHYRRKLPGTPAARDNKLRVRVQIEREHYLGLKAYFADIARWSSTEELAMQLYCVPFEPYAPVRRQMLNILREVNDRRKAAGLVTLPPKVLRYRRRIVKPFQTTNESTDIVFFETGS